MKATIFLLLFCVLGVTLLAQLPQPPQDIRLGQRTVFVWHPETKSLVVTTGAARRDVLICVPYYTAATPREPALSCKTTDDISAWILRNGN